MATYYRWQKQVWDAGTGEQSIFPVRAEEARFAEYKPPASTTEAVVLIHLDCGSVEIQEGAGQTMIEQTQQALKHYAL